MQRPEALQKLKVIPGDVTKNGLGISESDHQTLIEKVNIVFHSAATVKFDEDLKLALDINLQGTKRIIELCKSLKHLEVSSAILTLWNKSAPHFFLTTHEIDLFLDRLLFTFQPLIVIAIGVKLMK